ncbi:7156_t:CDS:2, partial [Ambispora gerdemannii]
IMTDETCTFEFTNNDSNPWWFHIFVKSPGHQISYLPIYKQLIKANSIDTHIYSGIFQIATSKYETADDKDPFVNQKRVDTEFGTIWELRDQDGKPELNQLPSGSVKPNILVIKNSSRDKVALGLFTSDVIAVIKSNVWVDTRAAFELSETPTFFVGISADESTSGNMLKNKITVRFDGELNYATITLSPPVGKNPPQLQAKYSFKSRM